MTLPSGGSCWVRKPCKKCGGPKPAGQGRLYCEDCEDVVAWEREKRAEARKVLRRNPCSECRGPKGPGKYRLCKNCRAKRQGPRPCERCGAVAVPRDSRRKLCDTCTEAAAERRRELDRERRRRDRQDPVRAQALREANHRWFRRVLADPERRDQWRETKRFEHRARAIANGKPMRRASTVTPPAERRNVVPGYPLAAALDRIAQRRSATGNPFASVVGEQDDSLTTLCESVGTTTRNVYGWRVGERDVSLDRADMVLSELGLLWWDVWNEDTVRRHILTVTSYRQVTKKLRSGRPTSVRIRVSRKFYGDQGPDCGQLAEIERAFTGGTVSEEMAA